MRKEGVAISQSLLGLVGDDTETLPRFFLATARARVSIRGPRLSRAHATQCALSVASLL